MAKKVVKTKENPNKHKIVCISVMEDFRNEYLQLVEEEKKLDKLVDEALERNDNNWRKKEVSQALGNLRKNQYFQQQKLDNIARTFIAMYK